MDQNAKEVGVLVRTKGSASQGEDVVQRYYCCGFGVWDKQWEKEAGSLRLAPQQRNCMASSQIDLVGSTAVIHSCVILRTTDPLVAQAGAHLPEPPAGGPAG